MGRENIPLILTHEAKNSGPLLIVVHYPKPPHQVPYSRPSGTCSCRIRMVPAACVLLSSCEQSIAPSPIVHARASFQNPSILSCLSSFNPPSDSFLFMQDESAVSADHPPINIHFCGIDYLGIAFLLATWIHHSSSSLQTPWYSAVVLHRRQYAHETSGLFVCHSCAQFSFGHSQ